MASPAIHSRIAELIQGTRKTYLSPGQVRGIGRAVFNEKVGDPAATEREIVEALEAELTAAKVYMGKPHTQFFQDAYAAEHPLK